MSENDAAITEKVKSFYESNPYPGVDERLGFDGARRLAARFDKPGRILFPGCGTGHGIVAMAHLRPDLECYGIDLSEPSLDMARRLADKYQAKVELMRGDYMQPLPWGVGFRYITLQGTLHHTADPKKALVNLVKHLDDEG